MSYLFKCLSGNGIASRLAQSLVHLECLWNLVFCLQVTEEEAKHGSIFDGRIGALSEIWQHGMARVATIDREEESQRHSIEAQKHCELTQRRHLTFRSPMTRVRLLMQGYWSANCESGWDEWCGDTDYASISTCLHLRLSRGICPRWDPSL